MIKESLSDAGLAFFAAGGLVIFFAVFVAITAWAFTRRPKQLATWSSLPLADGPDPVEPRTHGHHDDHECKNCGDCSCSKDGSPSVVSING